MIDHGCGLAQAAFEQAAAHRVEKPLLVHLDVPSMKKTARTGRLAAAVTGFSAVRKGKYSGAVDNCRQQAPIQAGPAARPAGRDTLKEWIGDGGTAAVIELRDTTTGRSRF